MGSLKLSPAARRALAYVHLTGEFPSHLHVHTFSAAFSRVELEPYEFMGVTLHRKQINEAGLKAIESDPLYKAGQRIKALGFTVSRGRNRNTSHYVPFHYDKALEPWQEVEALAYRSGGGSVTVRHSEVPYVTRFDLDEAESAWPAILRPAMYVGERLPSETGNDYVRRAVSVYRDGLT